MTRRFRLSLFVCLAAAVGLHVRPCILTLLLGGAPGVTEYMAGGADRPLDESTTAPGHGLLLAAVRPTLATLLDAPAFIGVRTAAAEGR